MVSNYLKMLICYKLNLGVGCHYIQSFISLLLFHQIIIWVDLWESMSSHNITGLLLGCFRIFWTPYYVVRLINTPSQIKSLCLRYIFWRVVSVYMEWSLIFMLGWGMKLFVVIRKILSPGLQYTKICF